MHHRQEEATKLVYIANARIPSEKAHPYQILKMCEAFVKNGMDVELVVPFRVQTNKQMRAIRSIRGSREPVKPVTWRSFSGTSVQPEPKPSKTGKNRAFPTEQS